MGSWFHCWLSEPAILGIALDGLGERVLRGMRATVAWHEARGGGAVGEGGGGGGGGGARGEGAERAGAPPPVELTLFAGHDVTLLPMLFALGAWRCKPRDGDDAGGSGGGDDELPAWPGYGAALAFELFEDVAEDAAGDVVGGAAARRWVVEVAHRPGAAGGGATKDFARSEWVTLLSLPLQDFEAGLDAIAAGKFPVPIGQEKS